jgi:hypothetical protein
MASWEDVSRLALALPEAVESDMRGNRAWKFTTPHFEGYPAVLIRLGSISAENPRSGRD